MTFAASSSAKLLHRLTPHPATADTFKFSIRSNPAYVQCAHRTWDVFLACSSHVTVLTLVKTSGKPPPRKCPHLFRSSPARIRAYWIGGDIVGMNSLTLLEQALRNCGDGVAE